MQASNPSTTLKSSVQPELSAAGTRGFRQSARADESGSSGGRANDERDEYRTHNSAGRLSKVVGVPLDPGNSPITEERGLISRTGHRTVMPLDRLPEAPASLHLEEDDRVATSIRERLCATGYQELRRIDVNVESGHVSLSGRVARYYLMQLAQNAALEASGVRELRNGIEVVRR